MRHIQSRKKDFLCFLLRRFSSSILFLIVLAFEAASFFPLVAAEEITMDIMHEEMKN